MPDIITSKVFVDGEKGITATKMNQIISGAVIQPAFYSAKPSSATLDPTDVLLELKGGAYAQITGAQIASSVSGQLVLADTTQNGMLRKVSGLTTDVVDGTNNCRDLSSSPALTSMRLRSYNAIGNPTFEVDQRNVGVGLTNPAAAVFIQDRWFISKSALTGTVNTALQNASTSPIVIPGTNFGITQKYQRFTVGTAQAVLAAADYFMLSQLIEGPRWRELSMDVHSVSLLVRSSVAGLAFSLALVDAAAAHSLVKLCTISAANTWTLIQLPNLPIWSGTYDASPGQTAYNLYVNLACGTNHLGAANNAWQTAGGIWGVTGMSNFLTTSGSTFDIAFVQHEPGPNCTLPIDYPFSQNHHDCLRYFQKSYDYGTTLNAAGNYNGVAYFYILANGQCYTPIRFHRPMAKVPTINGYSPVGGANAVYDVSLGTNRAITGSIYPGQTGFGGFSLSTVNASSAIYSFHWAADTGF